MPDRGGSQFRAASNRLFSSFAQDGDRHNGAGAWFHGSFGLKGHHSPSFEMGRDEYVFEFSSLYRQVELVH